MENGDITNNQITAYRNDQGNEYKARLNNRDGDYWDARSGSNINDLGFITVDLRNPMYVTKVATQVKEVNGIHIIEFNVFYKMQENDNWGAILAPGGSIYVSEQNILVYECIFQTYQTLIMQILNDALFKNV